MRSVEVDSELEAIMRRIKSGFETCATLTRRFPRRTSIPFRRSVNLQACGYYCRESQSESGAEAGDSVPGGAGTKVEPSAGMMGVKSRSFR